MKKYIRVRWLMLLLAVFMAWPVIVWAAGQHAQQSATGEQLARIMKGGLLYDKWYGELEITPPSATHPKYAASQGKRKGKGTWRCKECHGWDYRGRDGAYRKGSHFSGIAGIRGSAGGNMNRVIAELKGGQHGLGKYMPDSAIEALAAFVVEGQIDMDEYIDRESKKVRGDPDNGKRVYLTICARCHGDDGREINFKTKKNPVYLGKVARDNPWETLHKIRMGQPDEEMPALLAFPVQIQVDVLAYSQTLPVK